MASRALYPAVATDTTIEYIAPPPSSGQMVAMYVGQVIYATRGGGAVEKRTEPETEL